MCSLIIIILVLTIIAVLYIGAGLLIGTVVFGVMFLVYWSKYNQVKNIQPSTMICRNCGSTNVKINAQMAGTVGSGAGVLGGGFIFHGGQTAVLHKRIKVCQDCGFYDDYIMPEDINALQDSARGRMYVAGFFFLVCAGILAFLIIGGMLKTPAA